MTVLSLFSRIEEVASQFDFKFVSTGDVAGLHFLNLSINSIKLTIFVDPKKLDKFQASLKFDSHIEVCKDFSSKNFDNFLKYLSCISYIVK